MGIERLKSMKDQLLSCIEGQMHDLKRVDAKELGEAVDMVKDLEEAIYYCTIVEAMHKTKDGGEENTPVNNTYYYGTNYPIRYNDTYRYMDRDNGHMYYTDRMRHYQGDYSYGAEHHEPYTETTVYERDPREGKSALKRKMYMEGKENKKSKDQQMKELEAYMQELSTDVTEMIRDASPEEKAILRQKMTTLASKIA